MRKINLFLIFLSFPILCFGNCAHGMGMQSSKERGLGIKPTFTQRASLLLIHFETGSYKIRKADESLLDTFVEQANKSKMNFIIVGHTDERGASAFNLFLGDKRARSVLRYFVERRLDPERFLILSKGKTQPVDPASSTGAWAKNRRVEILVW